MRPDSDKERFGLVPFRAEPVNGFLSGNDCRSAFDNSNGLAIADEVFRINMIWRGIVLGGKPPVIAVAIGLGLTRIIKKTVEMPLARMTGGVAL